MSNLLKGIHRHAGQIPLDNDDGVKLQQIVIWRLVEHYVGDDGSLIDLGGCLVG